MQAIVIKMFMSLLSEAFLKKVVLIVLEWAVKQSSNDVDDKLVAALKEAWNGKKD